MRLNLILVMFSMVLFFKLDRRAFSSDNDGFAINGVSNVDKNLSCSESKAAQLSIIGPIDKTVEQFNGEGKLPNDPRASASRAAYASLGNLLNFTLKALASNDEPHLEEASIDVAKWLKIYKPSFNPISETGLDRLIFTIDLLKASKLKKFEKIYDPGVIRELAMGYVDHAEKVSVSKDPGAAGNWQSHRVKLATLASYAIGDEKLIARAKRVFQTQVDKTILKDGSVIDFHSRDALHYVVYTLEPLLIAALAAKNHKSNWYSYVGDDGAGLREALLWLEPYADGSKTHKEFEHSSQEFDRVRKDAGLQDFNGEVNLGRVRNALALGALFDPAFSRWRSDDLPLWLSIGDLQFGCSNEIKK